VIEEKSVRRLGGLRVKSFNARIVAATNRNLEAAIVEEAFRPDLYYRIKAITLEVPPLRSRGGDILLLAKHFLERFTRRYGLPGKRLSSEAESALLSYTWPGNVRELAHLIERAILLHEGLTITPEHFGLSRSAAPIPIEVSAAGVRVDFSSGGIRLEDVERHLIVEALRASMWKRGRAARLLGISKETLRYRMEKHRLHPPT